MLKTPTFRKIALMSEMISLEEEKFDQLDSKYLSEFRRDFKLELEFLNAKTEIIKAKDEINFRPSISKESLKKFHRALVKVTHPDHNPDHENGKEFMKIQRAYEQGNVSVMVEAAVQNEIDIDLSKKDLFELEKQLQVRQRTLEQKKQSVRWIWGTSDKNDLLRNQIRKAMGIDEAVYRAWIKNNC